ncbi:SseB family protein [Micromonospora sp. H33]|uniref:SseB family protein n=1 Tax=Micromonospora sp. H33 TaxID=3452215 RepID=UPI003F8BF74F
MTEWEPATEAEAALRDALRANDQQLYFRILSRTDLFLPVSAQALAGQAPMNWGTWTTGGRTHVLAFTSAAAMRACLGEHAGASRRAAYDELASQWPNHEWWLAVNPGLPIEGYLPAWYVAQLSRGDVRLPGRTIGARARLERAETLARVRAAESAPGGGEDQPTTGPQGREPSAGQAPEGTVPLRPAPAPVPPPGTPLRSPAELRAAALRRPLADAGRVATPAGETDARWPAPPDPGGDRAGRRPADAPTNGRTGGEPERPNRRSFFEAASGRATRDERAVPPPRFARGSQPFPRRQPRTDPTSESPTQAFAGGDATRADRDAPPSALAPAGETSRTPQPRAAGEETRPVRFPVPDPATLQAYARPTADEEATQTLPRRRPTPPPPDPEPASIAEPVSGPPAPRRGFTPIVIEGTIIESRDLTVPPADPVGATGLRNDPALAVGTGAAALLDDRGPGVEPSPAAESLPQRPAVADTPGTAGGWEPTRPDAEHPQPGPTLHPLDDQEVTAPIPVPRPHVPEQAGPTPDALVAVPVVDDPAPVVAAGTFAAHPTVAGGTPVPDPVGAPGTAGPDLAGAPADAPVAPATAGPVDAAPRPVGPAVPVPADFAPANAVEEDLLDATGAGSTDTFLSTLLLARVLLPVAPDSAPGSRPGEPGFVWRTEELDGETFVVVYTSPERLAEHTDAAVETVRVRFVQLIHRWPDESWSFAVNPGSPIGAKLPGEQIIGLANWAAEVGLGADTGAEPEAPPAAAVPAERPRYDPPAPDPTRPVVMQKAVAPSQLAYYLERGYDRVSGFVHRAGELAHLTTPAQLFDALGLGYPDSPFARAAEEIYVLRWPAYRPSLYRIPYGGQNETAMRAMEGWVIERPPFRGNGFAPGESSDVVAEFKVDSARLPHGAQLWRIGADGTERVVATLDADALLWREVGDA